ncbi:MAG TPA: sulfotransferase [Solirubrobacteraceae bacterium]|nr:sulfotransferase [Solirubrobacteraceae bacterium]
MVLRRGSHLAAMTVPDFFIVGSPKTGTTALYEMLKTHPQVFMPRIKEPRFLGSDLRPRQGHEQAVREQGYPKTMAEYVALFEGAQPGQHAGEATPTYLWSKSAPDAIADLQPDARIIAILREPASFLRSLHLSFILGHNEGERDLRKAMSLEDARRAGKQIPRSSHRPQLLQYSEHVRYVEQLSRYQARFSQDQILVLIYDDFRRDNEGTLRRVLDFIGVDATAPVDVKQANVTRQTVRSQRAAQVIKTVSRGSGPVARSTKAATRALTTRSMRAGMLQIIKNRFVKAEVPPSDEQFMLELRRRFKPEVVALSDHLGRDLVSLWGYDKLD